MQPNNQALAEQAVKLGYVKTPQEYLASEERGRQLAKTAPGITPIDASKVGSTKPLDIPNQKNTSKTDKAMAAITTTPPAQDEPVKSSFGDIVSQSLANIKDPEQKAMVQQLLDAVDNTTGGKFSQAGEDVLSKLLDTQFSQKKRKSEEARLQEQAGLPELFAEQALIESNYDTSEAARNSRLLNETGGKTTISKSALSNRQSEIQRQYGLQVADNRINELVVAGKINSANVLIERKLDLKYGDLEAEIDLYKSQLEAITPFMNNEQKKIAEQRQFLLDQATNEINSARETQKQLELTKATALKNAMDRGASPLQIAQIQDAQSLAEVAQTGFTTTALEKAQLRTEGLQQRKLLADIESANAPSISDQINTLFSSGEANTPVTTKTVLAELLGSKAVSSGTKARIAPAVEVLNSLDEFANSNLEGKFTGIGLAGRVKEGIKGLFNMKSPEAIQNAQQIDAVNLKVQQWASGASLTEKQIKQVDKLTPTLNDSDKTVRAKTSQLYNFMLNQAEGNLLTEGINVQFPQVNLFEVRELYDKATPEQRKQLQELYPQLK